MTAILGDRMRRLMRRHGINQSQLAARAGTTQPNISKYLAGDREPSSGTLANIAAALHATSEYLLGLPESGADKPFGAIKAYCALHGGELSEAETRDLIMTPLSARGPGFRPELTRDGDPRPVRTDGWSCSDEFELLMFPGALHQI